MDLFVIRHEDIEQQKTIPNTLAGEVSENGVVCYG